MKVLVTGVAGQLGYGVARELIKRGHEVAGSDIHSAYYGFQGDNMGSRASYYPMDITDKKRSQQNNRTNQS